MKSVISHQLSVVRKALRVCRGRHGVELRVRRRQRNLGFTLVELLVAVGIIGILSSVISQVFFTTTRTNSKSDILTSAKQSGDFALDVMTRLIRSATGVTTDCAAGAGFTSDAISILGPDNAITTFECLADSGSLRIASTSASSVFLTSTNVALTGTSCSNDSLRFTCVTSGGVPRSVRISFTLSQVGVPPDQYNQTAVPFQTSVTIRN
ncbi:MAG: prepilin-type N-terminal cleavage/methylation domain-containing protein [bacterium]|nr:prepilin-type N-terminal cleavage/methylation domain-containing protein [bacterium]